MTEYTTQKHNLMTIGGGVEVQLTEFVYKADDKGPQIYIQSGLHGGETSQWSLYKLHQILMKQLHHGEVHIVPYANPLAWLQRSYYSTFGKFSLLDGKDYNRCFVDAPALDTTGILISRLEEMALRCSFVIDLHTSKKSNPFAIFTKKDYQKYIKAIGLKYNQFSDDAAIAGLHGTFNAFLDRHNIPNVTIECGGHDEYDKEKIEQVVKGVCGLLKHLEMIDFSSEQKQQYCFEKRKKVFAPAAGLVKYIKKTGERVERGDIIAEISETDNLSGVRYILAPEDAVIHVQSPTHILWQGDTVAELIPLDDLQEI